MYTYSKVGWFSVEVNAEGMKNWSNKIFKHFKTLPVIRLLNHNPYSLKIQQEHLMVPVPSFSFLR
jgi:hypothetical protein